MRCSFYESLVKFNKSLDIKGGRLESFVNSFGKYDTVPPRIIHQWTETRPFRDHDIDIAVDLVKRNAKLSENDSNLLRFYAKCGKFFENHPPPLSYVIKNCGIPDEKGWRRSRRKLEHLSLITYRNAGGRDHFIRVNWVVLCGLAMLEKPLEVGGKGHKNFLASPIKNALDNINKQAHLSQAEYDATANILSLLKPEDLRIIASAKLPENKYIWRKYIK